MSLPATTFTLPLGLLAPDAADAAWRVAGAQLIKLTRAPLVAALARHLGPGDEALRARLAAFLETELGTAVLTALVSAGLSAMPALPLPGVGAQAVPRLARELRVQAMADAADWTADLLAGPLREALATWISLAGTAPVATLGDGPAVVTFDAAEAGRTRG